MFRTASLLLGVAIIAANPCSMKAQAVAKQPNVVILLVDDMGYGDLGCHGNSIVKTPMLDRLHSESVRFTDFHVAPMCTPTRGQLMTGVDALRNGAMNVSSGRTLLRREYATMADFFAAAGYRCGLFGKWHLGENYPYRPHDRGFHETVYHASSHIGSAPDPWNNDYYDDTYWRNGVREKFTGYCTDIFFHEAMRFAKESRAANKPFFVYLPLNSAHGPHYVPAKYKQPYADQAPNVAAFFGMIANIDENVARFDALLAEQGVRDDTIFIFMTDNGATVGQAVFNAGMRGRKIELYDGGHRVPCFVRWPKGKFIAPCDVDALTECQDLLPTLIELCELPNAQSAKFDGMSLVPYLRSAKPQRPDRMCVVQFSRMNAPVPKPGDACVMWRKWRLVGDRELYDIGSDPGQQRDVAREHADIVAKMRAHYEQWWSGLAPRVNEPSAIVIGNDSENPVSLSPADWFNTFLDQQRQILMASPVNGPWHLEVERAGEYEITLSRWPREAELPIAGPAPLFKPQDGPGLDGKAIPAVRVRMQIGDIDDAKPIGPDDRGVKFQVQLPAGRTVLQTWLYDSVGKELCGAYYAEVRRK
jgi:arylsulfatase